MIIFLVYLLIMGVILLAYGASYILKGIGMYTLGKARNMANPWLAFVPYARVWFQGELCGDIAFKERRLTNPGIWMLFVPIVSNIISGVFFGAIWSVVFVRISQTPNMLGSYDQYSYDSTFRPMGGVFLAVFFFAVMLSMITGAIESTLVIVVNNQIFARYTDKSYALVHAVAGIFIPLYTAVYFFLIRNRETVLKQE